MPEFKCSILVGKLMRVQVFRESATATATALAIPANQVGLHRLATADNRPI